jgi:hypothetical protein
MMNLFGVMLFLRMGWMAGQAGICEFDHYIEEKKTNIFQN